MLSSMRVMKRIRPEESPSSPPEALRKGFRPFSPVFPRLLFLLNQLNWCRWGTADYSPGQMDVIISGLSVLMKKVERAM